MHTLIRLGICLIALFLGVVVVPRVAFAGRTCCEAPGNDPSKCQGCDESGTYWKNYGDNCGGDPTCRTCPASHPVGNACGGSPPGPPSPPPCTCGNWTNGACRTGGCANGYYPQYRSCTPSGCQTSKRCVFSESCVVKISSTIEVDPSLKGGTPPLQVGAVGSGYCTSPDIGDPYGKGSVTATDTSLSPPKVYTGTIAANGTYTIRMLDPRKGTYCVKYDPGSADVVTVCPASGEYCGQDAPTTQKLKFYVSKIGSSWFQTMGGDIAAMGNSGKTISNSIPATCVEPWCKPYFSLPLLTTDMGSVGAVINVRGTTIDLQDMPGNQSYEIGPVNINRNVQTNTGIVCRENYDYFYRLYSLGLSPTGDFNNPGDARKPTNAPNGGKAAYYYEGLTPLTIASPWNLSGSANESIVVFVKGDLHIANTVQVEPGAFLAFIVSGSITIDPSVGTSNFASTTDGQVQGVFVSNRGILVQSIGGGGVEKKLVAEGTFASCGGIQISRDFRNGGNGLENNRNPGALFIYRPDFVLNTPKEMKASSYVWQEIAP